MKLRAAFLAAVIAALAAAPIATAAPWKRVTAEDGSGIDQVGLARTADGVLHLAWHDPDPTTNTEDLLHTVISRDGRIGSTEAIESDWTGFTNPALVVESGGLRAFWGGFRTTDSNDPQQEISTSLLAPGRGWELMRGQVNPAGGQSYASPISATIVDGVPLQAWAGTLGTWVHAGLDPDENVAVNHNYMQRIGQYGYDPNLVTDASGKGWMAWYSSAAAKMGVLAEQVSSTGAPATGEVFQMPGTSQMNIGMQGRTPLTARAGGGVYVAYPTPQAQDEVRVWRVGSGRAPVVVRKRGSGPVTVAAAGDGRLWLIWDDRGGVDAKIHARRSNKRATEWGAEVVAGRPKGTLQAYRLDASAIGGSADVLGVFNIGTSTKAATFHTRLLPGLQLTARREKGRVVFAVEDAGDPVRGARVTAGGKSGTTDRRGKLALELPARRLKATATKAGYVKDTLRLRAR